MGTGEKKRERVRGCVSGDEPKNMPVSLRWGGDNLSSADLAWSRVPLRDPAEAGEHAETAENRRASG